VRFDLETTLPTDLTIGKRNNGFFEEGFFFYNFSIYLYTNSVIRRRFRTHVTTITNTIRVYISTKHRIVTKSLDNFKLRGRRTPKPSIYIYIHMIYEVSRVIVLESDRSHVYMLPCGYSRLFFFSFYVRLGCENLSRDRLIDATFHTK